jgi:adenosylcobinamide-GDP ribazoletransferase
LLTSFLAAISFLSVIPLRTKFELTSKQISDSRAYYPIVGLLIGCLLVFIGQACSYAFTTPITAAILTIFLALITRGLHLDGLMDISDGLFGGYSTQQRLDIMKDSHVGAFAVLSATLILLLKYSAILSILNMPFYGKEYALVLAPTISRWSMVLQLTIFSYVRSEGGLGSPFQDHSAKLTTSLAAVTAFVLAIIFGGVGGVALLVLLSVLAYGLGLVVSRMIGGLTGDVYGATNELVETTGLVVAVPFITHGWLVPYIRISEWLPEFL